jgi:TRAP-type C4-dicarboxylate transport system permease small subunit
MLKKIIYILYDILLYNIVKILGFFLVLVVLLQIFNRFLMSTPLCWTEELSRFLFIWFCFLGSVVTLVKRQHLGIDIFYRRLSIKKKKLMDFFIYVLIIIFGVVMIIYGGNLVNITSIQKSPVMRIAMSYIYISLPITGVLYVIFCLSEVISLFR